MLGGRKTGQKQHVEVPEMEVYVYRNKILYTNSVPILIATVQRIVLYVMLLDAILATEGCHTFCVFASSRTVGASRETYTRGVNILPTTG